MKGLARRRFPEYASDNLKALLPKLERYGPDFRNELNLTPYMVAVNFGAENILQYLGENGADISLSDNYWRNALQMAVLKVYTGEPTYKKAFARLFGRLKGSSLSVKADNRLIKLGSHQAEYFMLHFMLAVLRPHVMKGLAPRRFYYGGNQDTPTFQTKDFISFYEGMPETVLPGFRAKRAYISSILAKNEINGGDRYNKRLFVRVQQGHYLPSPSLEISVGRDWVNAYDLIGLDELLSDYAHAMTGYVEVIQLHRERLKKDPEVKFDAEAYWKDITGRQMRQMLKDR